MNSLDYFELFPDKLNGFDKMAELMSVWNAFGYQIASETLEDHEEVNIYIGNRMVCAYVGYSAEEENDVYYIRRFLVFDPEKDKETEEADGQNDIFFPDTISKSDYEEQYQHTWQSLGFYENEAVFQGIAILKVYDSRDALLLAEYEGFFEGSDVIEWNRVYPWPGEEEDKKESKKKEPEASFLDIVRGNV